LFWPEFEEVKEREGGGRSKYQLYTNTHPRLLRREPTVGAEAGRVREALLYGKPKKKRSKVRSIK